MDGTLPSGEVGECESLFCGMLWVDVGGQFATFSTVVWSGERSFLVTNLRLKGAKASHWPRRGKRFAGRQPLTLQTLRSQHSKSFK